MPAWIDKLKVKVFRRKPKNDSIPVINAGTTISGQTFTPSPQDLDDSNHAPSTLLQPIIMRPPTRFYIPESIPRETPSPSRNPGGLDIGWRMRTSSVQRARDFIPSSTDALKNTFGDTFAPNRTLYERPVQSQAPPTWAIISEAEPNKTGIDYESVGMTPTKSTRVTSTAESNISTGPNLTSIVSSRIPMDRRESSTIGRNPPSIVLNRPSMIRESTTIGRNPPLIGFNRQSTNRQSSATGLNPPPNGLNRPSMNRESSKTGQNPPSNGLNRTSMNRESSTTGRSPPSLGLNRPSMNRQSSTSGLNSPSIGLNRLSMIKEASTAGVNPLSIELNRTSMKREPSAYIPTAGQALQSTFGNIFGAANATQNSEDKETEEKTSFRPIETVAASSGSLVSEFESAKDVAEAKNALEKIITASGWPLKVCERRVVVSPVPVSEWYAPGFVSFSKIIDTSRNELDQMLNEGLRHERDDDTYFFERILLD